MARINKESIDRFYDYDIHVESRTIYMGSVSSTDGAESGTDYSMAERLIKGLIILDSAAPAGDKPITIIMNNPGGDTLHGMAMYDMIQNCKNHITIVVYGQAMSMGAWVLQAADKRIAAKNSRIMIHTGYMGLPENHPEINKKWMDQFVKDEEIFENILLEKIKKKKPSFTKKQMKELMRFDTIFTPEQALDYNLIDEIV